jgi:hydrogenase nickel incorporation protein HypB
MIQIIQHFIRNNKKNLIANSMCDTCGCGEPGQSFRIYKPGETEDKIHTVFHHHHDDDDDHSLNHNHSHDHLHPHDHSHNTISIEQDILGLNNKMAERNRGFLEAKNIIALNLVSSPGSGKTTLLEKTLLHISGKKNCYVIEGDQQTDNDAKRIAATGAQVVQINTGNGCHLDATMVHNAIHTLLPVDSSIVFIENVGNLVCPALFDLGENHRIVIFSVTEGEDKPLKYPNMFHTSDVCIFSKIDLLPYLDFNIELAKNNVLKINPKTKIIELSVKSDTGFQNWLDWLENQK